MFADVQKRPQHYKRDEHRQITGICHVSESDASQEEVEETEFCEKNSVSEVLLIASFSCGLAYNL